MKIDIVLFSILCFEIRLICSQTSIPESLKECYRTESALNPKLPLNLRIITDIVQKLERHSYGTTNLRTMSSAILHRFKFDGIEYQNNVHPSEGILPFGATGTQRIKHKLIEDLIPSDIQTLPVHVLSQTERCILHRSISNTILRYDIDGNNTCTRPVEIRNETGRVAKCPIQQGVILTSYGTIAPGAIIGAIAASLQRQNVAVKQLISNLETSVSERSSTNLRYNEEEIDLIVPRSEMSQGPSMWYETLIASSSKVDNVWLTTIAGELAEMVVYQGPLTGFNMTLGATGFWQNRICPTIFYLADSQENFHATRAELIGGIDGMIIANNLQTWIEDFYSLRLSQILETYYSYEGVAFNANIRACERSRAFLYSVPKTILDEQTYAIAQMLAYRNSIAYISPETLKKLVECATEKFYTYAESHLFPELPCQKINRSRVETLVVFDGSWPMEYTTDLLAVLIQDLDVSTYGSKIGIIHGTTGEWLLNVTNSPSLAFETLTNFTNVPWPTELNYVKVLNTIFAHLNKTWENKEKHGIIGNLGQVVLLLTPLGSMSNNEKVSATTILRRIKYNHPEVNFVYYTSRSNTDLFQSFILSDEDRLIDNSNIDSVIRYISTSTLLLLLYTSEDIEILVVFVQRNECYLAIRRLHKSFGMYKIHSFGYGSVNACSWTQFGSGDEEKFRCVELAGYEEVKLTNQLNCVETSSCPDIYLEIRNVTSLYKCAEIECKTPDQVRFIVRTKEEIVRHENSANKNKLALLNFLTLFILVILI
nr:PREDICTED: uncharacterized protein LOC100883936 isoform X2 [Megachile rotundata]